MYGLEVASLHACTDMGTLIKCLVGVAVPPEMGRSCCIEYNQLSLVVSMLFVMLSQKIYGCMLLLLLSSLM